MLRSFHCCREVVFDDQQVALITHVLSLIVRVDETDLIFRDWQPKLFDQLVRAFLRNSSAEHLVAGARISDAPGPCPDLILVTSSDNSIHHFLDVRLSGEVLVAVTVAALLREADEAL